MTFSFSASEKRIEIAHVSGRNPFFTVLPTGLHADLEIGEG